MTEFLDHLRHLIPLLETEIQRRSAETPALEQELCDAELAPYSRDLSGQRGAEQRLDRHREAIESLETLRSDLDDAIINLEG